MTQRWENRTFGSSALPGALRKVSYNRALLRAAQELAPPVT